jgi:hypothetical protein
MENFLEVLNFNWLFLKLNYGSFANYKTLNCLINVGYRLELRIATTFLLRVSFLVPNNKNTQFSLHNKEYNTTFVD